MGMLDRLLRQRLDHWHYPNLSKLGIWTGYCHAILDKAAASNQKKEYQNSFHNRNPQEMRRTLDQNKQINDCWYAWLEAFSEVLRLLPHNAWEETEPTSSEHKAEALRAIEKAEATCRFHAVPGLTPPGHMPPLAPQRPSSGQLTGTGKQPGSSSSTKPGTPPRVLQGHTSVDVARHAHELGENHPDWWKNEGKDHQIRKCNLFADRVFRDLQIPLPWDGQSTPTVQGMLPKLANSNDWSLVYSDDKPFGTYVPQPGDFALWNKTIVSRTYSGGTLRTPLQHCGIIGTDGEIMYAGSGVTGGYAESDFNLMRAAATYGAPTAIYRSTHLDH
jgi:hypothetical protein